MATIHGVPIDSAGLAGFGKPDGYMARQLARWQRQWELSKTRDIPAYDELVARLTAGLPESADGTLVHGDFRLDNTLVTLGQPAKIAAVVDWEMSTLGDPLADLGLTLSYWADSTRPRLPGHQCRGYDHGAARLLHPPAVRRPVRRADRPRRLWRRLLHSVRLLQARRRARGDQRQVPAGQDRRRGIRPGRPGGAGADRPGTSDAGFGEPGLAWRSWSVRPGAPLSPGPTKK